MKTLLYISALALLILGSCTSSLYTGAEYDDLYYTPSDQPSVKANPPAKQQNADKTQKTDEYYDNIYAADTLVSDEYSDAVDENIMSDNGMYGDGSGFNYDNYYSYSGRLNNFYGNYFNPYWRDPYYMYGYPYPTYGLGLSYSFGFSFGFGYPYYYGYGYPYYGYGGYYDYYPYYGYGYGGYYPYYGYGGGLDMDMDMRLLDMEEMSDQATLPQTGTETQALQVAPEEIRTFHLEEVPEQEEHQPVAEVRLLLRMPEEHLHQVPIQVHSRAETQCSRRLLQLHVQ